MHEVAGPHVRATRHVTLHRFRGAGWETTLGTMGRAEVRGQVAQGGGTSDFTDGVAGKEGGCSDMSIETMGCV